MKRFWKSSYFALIMLFIYVPIVVMIIFSFNSGSTVTQFQGWSGKWYDSFFSNRPFVISIVTSLFVAVVATIISLIIGTMAAIGLSKCKSVTQKWWVGIANIPLINADIVTAVSLMMVFMLCNMQFGIGTLILAHISFDIPYVLITVMPSLRKVDKAMLEAADDLGAKPSQTLFKVILPVLRPAIISAAAIAFSMSFDDFIISYFTGGNVTNVSTFIYTAKNIKPYIFAFGTILVAVIILGVIIWNAASAIKMKVKEEKEQIKKGYYKQETLNKLNEKLTKEYIKLNDKKQMRLSRNPFLWIHYWYLKMLIKLYSIRNFDKKISKLEWKAAKLKNEIRNEKRYYTRLKKTSKAIKSLEKEIAKAKVSKAKYKKLTNKLDALNDKKDYLESEIEWIENRDERQERKAAKITKRIKQLNREFKKEFDDLSKSDIAWYRKKIKNLEEWKVEVEEGKAHYKLRMTTDRLKELKDLRNNKLFELAKKKNAVHDKIFVWRDLGYKYDRKLNATRGKHDWIYANTLVAKDRYVAKKLRAIEWRIIKNENKIDKTNQQVAIKKEKYFPTDDQPIKPKNWLQRSWKWISIIFVAAGAFSGLTAAYVIETQFDFTVGNWGEYIDPELLNEFESETGLHVNYQVYNSNEDLEQKLKTFNYDVMIPSDYMVQRLAQNGTIRPIDYSQLHIEDYSTGKKYKPLPVDDKYKEIGKIDSSLVGDKGLMTQSKISTTEVPSGNLLDYAIPYFVGDLSLVFNTQHANVAEFLSNQLNSNDVKGVNLNDKLVNPDTGKKTLSWGIVKAMADKGMTVRLQDDTKNLFMLADQALYGRVNFKDPILDKTTGLDWKQRVDKSSAYVKDLMNKSNVYIQGDDMYSAVQTGDFDVAMMYSGDVLRITNDMRQSSNAKNPYSYVRPYTEETDKDGKVIKLGERTNVYTDNMCVSARTKDEKKIKYAYEFIDFMFRKENAIRNSKYVGLYSPNTAASEAINKDNDSYQAGLYKVVTSQFPDWYTDSGIKDDKGNVIEPNPLSYQNDVNADHYITWKDPRN